MSALNTSPVLIALLGVTGAGKTTFVSLASGRTDLKIGYGVDPCTQDPTAVRFLLGNRQVVLIDTPGFDDDMRSDVDILEDIAKWMAKQGYLKNALDGLIFLHPITLNRVGGSERNRTKLLERILGEHAYNRVLIATTMWDDLKADVDMDERLYGRVGAGGVWHDMCSRGALITKHFNNKESATKIISKMIEISDKYGKTLPQLHVDLKTTRGHVGKTGAGKELERQLKKDIKLLKESLDAHLKDKPAELSRKDRTAESRKEMKDWIRDKRLMEERLQLREQQLKRLNSMVVRFVGFLASIFVRS